MDTFSFPAAFNRVLAHDLLSAEDERRLASKAQRGDDAAVGQLVTCNARLAYAMAQTFASSREDVPDLYSAAMEGLVMAARRYNPRKFKSRKARFSTYAAWYIRQRMQEFSARVLTTGVALSTTNASLLRRVRSLLSQFREEHGREATAAYIAEKLGLAEEKAARLMGVAVAVSLDSPTGPQGDGSPLHTFVPADAPSAADEAELQSRLELLRQAISGLPRIEQDVIRRRFGLDGRDEETLESLARTHKITRERVRQIEAKALRALRLSAARKTSCFAELAA